MTNSFKRLALIDRVPKELRAEVHSPVQQAVVKNIPQKEVAEKGREVKGNGRKERYTH